MSRTGKIRNLLVNGIEYVPFEGREGLYVPKNEKVWRLQRESERLRAALRFLLSVQNAKWVPSEHVDEWLEAVQQSRDALGEEK